MVVRVVAQAHPSHSKPGILQISIAEVTYQRRHFKFQFVVSVPMAVLFS